MRARARTSLQSRAWHRRSISAIDRMNRSPSTCRPNAALKSKAPLPKRLRRCRPHGVHTFDSPANDRAARCASISPVARFAASRCERRAQARSRRFASIRQIRDKADRRRWSNGCPRLRSMVADGTVVRVCVQGSSIAHAIETGPSTRRTRHGESSARTQARAPRTRAVFRRRTHDIAPKPSSIPLSRRAIRRSRGSFAGLAPIGRSAGRPCALARPIAARPHDEGLRNDRSARRPPPDIRRADNPLRSHHAIRVANTPPRASLTTRRT